MNKKGAELSLNVIIIAIIVLIVLVVLIVIFTEKTSIFARTTSGCEARGGTCVDGTSCPASSAPAGFGIQLCDAGKICCIQLDTNEKAK